MSEKMRNILKWTAAFLCLGCFLFLAIEVSCNEKLQFDTAVYNAVSKFLISDFATPIVKVITNLGGAVFLITLTVTLLILIKNKKIGLSITVNLIVITLLNHLLKIIFQRPRPVGFRLIEETGYSFPSGHSMINMAFYGYLIYLICRYVENKWLKYTLVTLLSILICLIGISRIYLGVHYASDVLAGFFAAIFYLVIYITMVKKIFTSRKGSER